MVVVLFKQQRQAPLESLCLAEAGQHPQHVRNVVGERDIERMPIQERGVDDDRHPQQQRSQPVCPGGCRAGGILHRTSGC